MRLKCTEEAKKQRRREAASRYYYKNRQTCNARTRKAEKERFEKMSPEEKQEFLEIKREKRAAYHAAYRKTHPDKRNNRERYINNRWEKLGINVEQYMSLRESKRKDGDLCGLCKRPLGDSVHLDHDHDTNSIRDFIHPKCNMAIGLFEDNSQLCYMAAKYLEKYKENINV